MSSDNGLDDLYRSILEIEVKEITDVNNKIQKIRDLYLLLQKFIHTYMQGIPDVINPQGIIDDYIDLSSLPDTALSTEEAKYNEALKKLFAKYNVNTPEEKKNEIKTEILNMLNNQYRKYLNTLIYYKIGIKFKQKSKNDCDKLLNAQNKKIEDFKKKSEKQREESIKKLEESTKKVEESNKKLKQRDNIITKLKTEIQELTSNIDKLTSEIESYSLIFESYRKLIISGAETIAKKKLHGNINTEDLQRLIKNQTNNNNNNYALELGNKSQDIIQQILEDNDRLLKETREKINDINDINRWNEYYNNIEGYTNVFKIEFYKKDNNDEYKFRVSFSHIFHGKVTYTHEPDNKGIDIKNYKGIDKIINIIQTANNDPKYIELKNLINYLNKQTIA
jgi:hypothetical protein